MGWKKEPEDFTWYHHHDKKTMMLVLTDLHEAVRHTGGDALIRARGALK